MTFRYASVYCPCENKEGMIAVWMQHKTFLQTKNDDWDPRKAFLEDLQEQIKQWIKEGDQVLVCSNFNHGCFLEQ
jgi:uncharacterized protein YecE (DUF72 family)